MGFMRKGSCSDSPAVKSFCVAGLWRDESGVKKYTMLTTTPNESVAKYHRRMPFILKPDQYDLWLGENWQQVLTEPDYAPLEKIQKQPELF